MSHDSSVERSDVSDSLQIYRTLETYMAKLDIPEATDAIVGNMKSHIEHLRHHETLNMFVPTSNATLHVKLDRVLLAMLDRCAPCVEGRMYTIRAIMACAEQAKEDHSEEEEDDDDDDMVLSRYLRAVAITWLTQFLFLFKAGDCTPPQNFENVTPTEKMPISANVGENMFDRNAVLRRDDYRCVITGMKDRHIEHSKGVGITTLQAAHVIKRAVAVFPVDPNDPSFIAATTTFNILRHYTQMPEEFIENLKDTIDQPYNLIMLTSHLHQMFDRYMLCLQKTNIAHHYKIQCFNDNKKRYLAHALQYEGRSLDDLVVFENHDWMSTTGDHALPNSIFIELHATIARIFHMSDAGQFFEKLISVYLPTGNGAHAFMWEDLEQQIQVYEFVSKFKAGLAFLPSIQIELS